MATSSIPVHTDWRQEWFEFEDATYLNLAGQSPMPKVSLRAIQSAIADKKYPHHRTDSVFYEIPNRIRTNIARLIGAKPQEIAITTGASAGVIAVAYALDWKPGDEVITRSARISVAVHDLEADGRARWAQSEDCGAARPLLLRRRCHCGDDSADAFGFGEPGALRRWFAARCEARRRRLPRAGRFADAGCEPVLRRGSDQRRELGADFLVCAGYKWLFGPFGTGFFWIKHELLASVRPAPFYWMAIEGSDNFAKLNFADPKPADSAKRWDAPEWASHFNFNLVGFDASLEFVLRIGRGNGRAAQSQP